MSELAVEIKGLEKSFKNFKLGPLDINVPKGSIYGLIGPNGAGKTTTIDLIMGMGKANAGTIKALGFDHIKDEVEMKKRIGYVNPDTNYNAWGKVYKLVNFIRGFYPDWDDDYSRSLFQNLNIGWKDKIRTLSFGTRTKLGVLLALSHKPELLLLDEPTIGLDAVSKQFVFSELLNVVQNDDRTVLISSNGLGDVERFADHIGMIKNGKILLEGATSEIVEKYKMVDYTSDKKIDLPETFFQGREDNRWRILTDTTNGKLEKIKSLGATQISVSPVTLEELFVGIMKEYR